MGKLVKYCSGCEEGFAERFGFCPNCGGQLEAFEMNPVNKNTETPVEANGNNIAKTEISEPIVQETALVTEAKVFETAPVADAAVFVPETVDFSGDDILELESVDQREPITEEETETLIANVPADDSNGNGFYADSFAANPNLSKSEEIDDGYHVTVVSQKAEKWYRPFVGGLAALALIFCFGLYIYDLWNHGYFIPEIDGVGNTFYSSLSDEDPIQKEEIQKKKDEAGGGGGGGGKNNPDPVSRGRVPNQSDTPTNLIPLPVIPNASLPIVNSTQGTNKREQTNEPIGNPNSLSDKLSSGSGSGGGMGTGTGTGYGSGRGTGEGSGIGSGSGGGVGNGNGDNFGDGDSDPKIKQKPVVSGVTRGVTITSKPQARYTDAARQNNVQGTVTLRVTFNADGTIGGVSPVNSLPNGLTEQAIAAAKQIKFQPAMRNGQAYAVTKQVVYSFTIY